MDLATVSCSVGQLMKHIRDETFTNIVSIAEFVHAKSGNEIMEEMYDKYMTARLTTP